MICLACGAQCQLIQPIPVHSSHCTDLRHDKTNIGLVSIARLIFQHAFCFASAMRHWGAIHNSLDRKDQALCTTVNPDVPDVGDSAIIAQWQATM
jgi:hypothetical protein